MKVEAPVRRLDFHVRDDFFTFLEIET